MGIHAEIYRSTGPDCTNGGLSATEEVGGEGWSKQVGAKGVCLVNVDGPFEPSDEYPAAMLVAHAFGTVRCVPAVPLGGDAKAAPGEWVEQTVDGEVGPMFGGNFVATSDARFDEKVRDLLRPAGSPFYGAIPLHDRFETAAEYEALST